jgi:hypothetical protein
MVKAPTELPRKGALVQVLSLERGIVAGVATVGDRSWSLAISGPPAEENPGTELPPGLVKLTSIEFAQDVMLPTLQRPFDCFYAQSKKLGEFLGVAEDKNSTKYDKAILWPLSMLGATVASQEEQGKRASDGGSLENMFEFDGLAAFGPEQPFCKNAIQLHSLRTQGGIQWRTTKVAYELPVVRLDGSPITLVFCGALKLDDGDQGGLIFVSMSKKLNFAMLGPKTMIDEARVVAYDGTLPRCVKDTFDSAVELLREISIDTNQSSTWPMLVHDGKVVPNGELDKLVNAQPAPPPPPAAAEGAAAGASRATPAAKKTLANVFDYDDDDDLDSSVDDDDDSDPDPGKKKRARAKRTTAGLRGGSFSEEQAAAALKKLQI